MTNKQKKQDKRHKIKGLTLTRALILDITRADSDSRSIPASLSSEYAVKQWSGTQTLLHKKSAINMEHASNGIPLLFNHDEREIIGRVGDLRIDPDKVMRGNLRFSRSQKGQDFYNDVLDGIITDVSMGGEIQNYKDVKGGIEVTKWMPLEASLTAIGADPTVGINRTYNEDKVMADEIEVTETEKKTVEKTVENNELNHDQFKNTRANARKEGVEQGKREETERREAIHAAFMPFERSQVVKDLRDQCLSSGTSFERSKELLLDAMGDNHTPIKTPGAGSHFTHGDDVIDKFKVGVTRALSVKVGCGNKEDIEDMPKNEFSSMNPVEIARAYLKLVGVNTAGFTRMQVVGEAFIRDISGGATTSDFPNILSNIAQKSLLMGYDDAEETWSQWARAGNLSDFKQADRVNLSEFTNLDEIPEMGEYEHGKFSDLAEHIQLATFGRLFTISRQALINDDLSALGRIPSSMGRAAARKVGDLAYNVLVSNPIMNQDGIPLFHVDHNNLTTGEITVDNVDLMRVAMGLQKGPEDSATLGIRPAHLIVPLELEGTARTLMAAQYNPASTAGTLEPNSVQNIMSVTAEHRLSSAAAGDWYMLASATMWDTVEIGFLDGIQTPYLEQKDGFTRDGVSYKVRIDAAAAPLDFRGAQKSEQ